MMSSIGFAFAVVASTQAAIAKDKITSLPGLPDGQKETSTNQYSGFIDLPGSEKKHLHYWLVEAEKSPETAPTVFWFNGGPGCSSLDGYFYEQGPYHVKEPIVNTTDGVPELYANPYAWNQIANMVFLEAPAGVGFSYAETQAGLMHNDTGTAEDNFAAVQGFFKGFPEYAKNDMFISGESYAGAYVPMLALQVLKHNERVSEAEKINLKGIMVGNGVTGQGSIPSDIGEKLDIEFLYGHGLFSAVTYEKITKACGDYKNPSNECLTAIGEMHQGIGNVNVYDIYTKCIMAMDGKPVLRAPAQGALKYSGLGSGVGGPDGCIDAGAASKYLNNPKVMEAIHVTEAKKKWDICGGIQYNSNQGSLLPDYKNILIPAIRVLIFNGDVDACVPYVGNQWWTSSLNMSVEKPWRVWSVNKQVAGYVTTYEQDFNFLTVKGSGHMVPQYRPEQAFAMFERMIENKPFDCEDTPKGC